MGKSNLYNQIKSDIDRMRSLINEDRSKSINESNDNSDAVPYTNKDEIMTNILTTAKTQFGADFTNFKTPMLYFPKDRDITLSGEISDLNNAKFQFRYKDSSGVGCYIWTEPLQLTDDNLRKLQTVLGVFKNWKKELSSYEDVKPMSLKNQNF